MCRIQQIKCTLGVSPVPAFAADFPPVMHKFYQRTRRVRLKNLHTTDKKSSRKNRHKEIPRVHFDAMGDSVFNEYEIANRTLLLEYEVGGSAGRTMENEYNTDVSDKK